MKGKIDKTSNVCNDFDLIVIDGMNVVHKFNSIFEKFCDSKKRPTGMFYGVLNFVCSLKKKYSAEIIFCWDTKPTSRIEIDKEYKANRDHTGKSDFYKQVDELKKLLSYYGITQYIAEGYEADDIAAKIVLDNGKKNILLVSNDNDWWQLLKNTSVNVLMHNKVYTKEDIEKEYNIDINSYTLYKALHGDSCDNIHSAIQKCSLDDLRAFCMACNGNIDNINESNDTKIKKMVSKNIETVMKNLELVTLKNSGYQLTEIKKKISKKKLITALRDYEMKALVKRIEL